MSKNRLLLFSGDKVPPDGTRGFVAGCEFVLTTAKYGMCSRWINLGTESSCTFAPVGPVHGYGIAVAGGPYDCTTGSATQTIPLPGQVVSTDIAFVNHAVSDDADQLLAVIATSGKNIITITASADPLTAHDYVYAVARDNCIPEWDIFAAGTHTTVGGGVGEAITVTGAVVGDLAFANYSATNDTDVISDVAVTANTVTVTSDNDPSTAHGYHYMVLRPRGTFVPSHYIFAAGVHTTVGGAAAEAITVTGALATDVAIVGYNTTDDTDTILKSVMTANTLTVTMSADPSTGHKLAYMILRAY